MRRPPPLRRLPSYPVTASVGLLAAATTIATMRGRSAGALVMDVRAFHGQPWRLLTSMLPHADAFHLAFNLYWLWVFGSAIEGTLGSAAMAGCVLLFSVGSCAAEYALFGSGVGLSGVGYGLFALAWLLSRRDRRFADVVDTRTAQLFAGWFVLCIVLTASNVWRVANVAHGAGAVFGLLVGLALLRRGGARLAAVASSVALLAGALLGASVLRARVNLSREVGIDSAALGYEALSARRLPEAVRWYRDALRLNPREASWWFNMGIAYQSSGDLATAADCYRRAQRLDAGNARYRDVAAQHLGAMGSDALTAGRDAEALALLLEASQLGTNEPTIWHNLGVAHFRAGHTLEAAEAFRRAGQAEAPSAAEGALTPGGESGVAPPRTDAGARD